MRKAMRVLGLVTLTCVGACDSSSTDEGGLRWSGVDGLIEDNLGAPVENVAVRLWPMLESDADEDVCVRMSEGTVVEVTSDSEGAFTHDFGAIPEPSIFECLEITATAPEERELAVSIDTVRMVWGSAPFQRPRVEVEVVLEPL